MGGRNTRRSRESDHYGRANEKSAPLGSLFDNRPSQNPAPSAPTESTSSPGGPGTCGVECTDGWRQYAPPGSAVLTWYQCARCNRHGARNPQPPDGGPALELVKPPPPAPEPPKPRPIPEGMKARNAAPDRFTERAPSAHGSATSRAAAGALTVGALRTQSQRVEAFIKTRGNYGATREEVADGLQLPLQSVNPRVVTLYKQGWIGSNPGHVRPTKGGSDAEVLLHEDWVERWKDTQRRPPTREPLK